MKSLSNLRKISLLANVLYLGVASILLIMIYFEKFEFELWGQVTYLRGTDIFSLNLLTQAHFLRYLLVFPIFFVSDFTGLDANWLFSLVAFFLILSISDNIARISCLSAEVNSENIYFILKLIILISIILLSSYMNGRVLFAIAGYSIILYNVLIWENKKISFSRMFGTNLIGHFFVQ